MESLCKSCSNERKCFISHLCGVFECEEYHNESSPFKKLDPITILMYTLDCDHGVRLKIIAPASTSFVNVVRVKFNGSQYTMADILSQVDDNSCSYPIHLDSNECFIKMNDLIIRW